MQLFGPGGIHRVCGFAVHADSKSENLHQQDAWHRISDSGGHNTHTSKPHDYEHPSEAQKNRPARRQHLIVNCRMPQHTFHRKFLCVVAGSII